MGDGAEKKCKLRHLLGKRRRMRSTGKDDGGHRIAVVTGVMTSALWMVLPWGQN